MLMLRALTVCRPTFPIRGIAAIAAERENTLDFADLLDQITDRTLLLILDGVTDPRNFGACLRAADAAGVQAVIVPRDRSAWMTPAAAWRRGRGGNRAGGVGYQPCLGHHGTA